MNLRSFDLNLLLVLDALLREGSTVKAGERVGLSQPAVSAVLARLRHALDDPLFIRHGQGLVPTDFARAPSRCGSNWTGWKRCWPRRPRSILRRQRSPSVLRAAISSAKS